MSYVMIDKKAIAAPNLMRWPRAIKSFFGMVLFAVMLYWDLNHADMVNMSSGSMVMMAARYGLAAILIKGACFADLIGCVEALVQQPMTAPVASSAVSECSGCGGREFRDGHCHYCGGVV